MKKKFLLMMLVSAYCLNVQRAEGAEPAAKRLCAGSGGSDVATAAAAAMSVDSGSDPAQGDEDGGLVEEGDSQFLKRVSGHLADAALRELRDDFRRAAASREDNCDSDSSDDTMTPDELENELSKIRDVRAARSGNAAAPVADSLNAFGVINGEEPAGKVFFQMLSCGHCVTVTITQEGDMMSKDEGYSLTRSIKTHNNKCPEADKTKSCYITLYRNGKGELQCPFGASCEKSIANCTEMAKHYNGHHKGLAPAAAAADLQII